MSIKNLPDPMEAWREAERRRQRSPGRSPDAPNESLTTANWVLVRTLLKDGLTPSEIAASTVPGGGSSRRPDDTGIRPRPMP